MSRIWHLSAFVSGILGFVIQHPTCALASPMSEASTYFINGEGAGPGTVDSEMGYNASTSQKYSYAGQVGSASASVAPSDLGVPDLHAFASAIGSGFGGAATAQFSDMLTYHNKSTDEALPASFKFDFLAFGELAGKESSASLLLSYGSASASYMLTNGMSINSLNVKPSDVTDLMDFQGSFEGQFSITLSAGVGTYGSSVSSADFSNTVYLQRVDVVDSTGNSLAGYFTDGAGIIFPDNTTFGNPDVGIVPLPPAAPLFGAALVGFAGFGYAAKRKSAVAGV